jgi:GH24 family phage-related lysozyme (muramidase)
MVRLNALNLYLNKMSLETASADFIKQFEGFTANAMWDVNAWRIGHGSDTIELPNGTHRSVVQTDTTTTALAGKDLARRIKDEFIPKVQKKIGEPYWSKLPEPAQVALLSIAYNYGNITKQAILDSARSGDMKKLGQAIVDSTYNDNASLPEGVRNALRARRLKEATLAQSAWETIKKYPKTSAGLLLVALGLIGLGYYLYKTKKLSAIGIK